MGSFKGLILGFLAFFAMFCQGFGVLSGAAALPLPGAGYFLARKVYLPVIVKAGPGLVPRAPQCVDCPKNISVMTGHSLRLDQNNRPHIAYGSDHLYHAWHDGSSWKFEIVDPAPGVGMYASLAFDSAGKPGICYLDAFNSLLKFARWTGSAWTIQTVDGPTSAYTYPTLLFDSSSNPLVAYIADFSSGYQVKFARWTGAAWNIYKPVDTSTSYFPSLALDGSGAPHISYFRDDYTRSGGLMYASWTGSDWSLQVVDEASYKGKDNSLAFDSTGKPHISYYDDWDGVKYASWNGSSWDQEMIHTGVSVDTPGQTSLAFAPGDVPLVAAALGDGDTHLVWLYKRVAPGNWSRDNLGTLYTAAGQYPSLAVTPDGKPRVSYFDYELGALRYASLTDWNWSTNPPNLWTNEILDFGAQVGQGVSVALDQAGRPHIAYMDLTLARLKYAVLANGYWKISLVDVPGIDPAHGHAIAIDPSGRPHIAYADFSTRKIMYASYDGSSWTAEAAADNPKGGMDDPEKFLALAISSSGVPHISFFSEAALNLQHAYKPGPAWVVEEVDKLTPGITGLYNALALDSLGHPHISYRDYKNYQLMYAYWNGSAWVKMVADSQYTTGMNTAIALDSANHPHICYSDTAGYYLKYAYYNGSSWSIATLTPNTRSLPDSRQPVCSIKIASGGAPLISYFDRASRHLTLARQVGGSWLAETLDGSGDNGEHNAMGLYNGVPYIGYYSRSTRDLLFVVWTP